MTKKTIVIFRSCYLTIIILCLYSMLLKSNSAPAAAFPLTKTRTPTEIPTGTPTLTPTRTPTNTPFMTPTSTSLSEPYPPPVTQEIIPSDPLQNHRVFLPLIELNVTPPTPSASFYVKDISGPAMWNLGCDFAISMITSNQSVVFSFLHFGQPWKEADVYGVKTHAYGFPFATNAEVVSAAVNFADGYGLCHDRYFSRTSLILGLGVNNYGPYIDYDNGISWGQVVSDIDVGLAGTFGEYTVFPVGAADMELSFNDEISTTDWFLGYFTGTGDYLYNFGAAEGCPSEDVPSIYDGQCGTPDYPNWRQSDVWFISSGLDGARAFPQIYTTDGYNADQWYQIALYGYRTFQLFPFVARGALTQFSACEQRPSEDGCQPENPYLMNTPQQGWEQFYNALRRDSRTLQNLPYSSDIEYQGE